VAGRFACFSGNAKASTMTTLSRPQGLLNFVTLGLIAPQFDSAKRQTKP
jgi:hypothetical protein